MRENSPFFIRPVASLMTGMVESRYLHPNLSTHLDFLESQLGSAPSTISAASGWVGSGRGGREGGASQDSQDSNSASTDFFCGDNLTGADIAMSFPLLGAKDRAGLTKDSYPLLWAYVERLEGIESYQRAVRKIREVEGGYEAKV